MNDTVPIYLAVEDNLSEAVLRKILDQSIQSYEVGYVYKRNGFGFLKKTINGFNNAAKGMPYIILTDLDRNECPPILIREWLSSPQHPNLIFRVAIRQVESWVLAHRDAFSRFLNISVRKIPVDTDTIDDSKKFLIKLASDSRYRKKREAIVPFTRGARTGPNYNGMLSEFIFTCWDSKKASKHSLSLKRAIRAIDSFKPTFGT